jgi:hypothetical protein
VIPILISAVLLAQQASGPVAVTTRVEGSVINSLNGEAVGSVTVILRARDQERGLSYADETDGNGHFSIDAVDPGEYALVAERPGFSFQSTGATGAPPPIVKVEAGQQIKDLRIRLVPLGVIAGRVLDADGDPVRGAAVSALRYEYADGKKELRSVGQIQSGDNGAFRIFGLRAGTFYLKATHTRQLFNGPPESFSTFYPNAADQGHAAPVELRTGAQLEGLEIRLQSAVLYSVRMEFAEGHAPEGGFGAYLASEQGIQQFSLTNISSRGFTFAGVPPGSYEVMVQHLDSGGTRVLEVQHVEVTSADVDGGTLTFLPAVEVPGAVRVDGGVLSGLGALWVNLQSEGTAAGVVNRSAEVKPDGAFLLTGAVPGVFYEVTIGRIPGAYLKSVRMGDKQLADRRFDLSSKPEPLMVVLGADIGEVEGTVQNAQGEPLARARVDAIAYGDHASRADLNRFGFTDEKGEFKIKDVPPGDYKVFAWEDAPLGAPQDPEFRKPFEKQAVAIRMQPNGHAKVQVTAIAAIQGDR